ncbi:MAG: flagellar basal body rod protein FlgC [Sphingomonadales bacterium CG12_big_fil_rev_8_21_14_0_65_65_10]|jgi:flagellar basal-body rod protein FlgC|uniref:Flagellar basal-body rod protein FlgC n=1 Tax=Blastomonas marina TaxID=1867408 RepID=A0ABQ1FI06_9SPHN|nr:flagellar basal body rod protein FlgC [Blastomonas marina]PIW55824.1 MAG: flagellar basal body rod protein FlgC [Sphingomonadales bacterium CG12_big_fil_rev_8_21_14_0_65_65_10]WPZ03590.1 flagellar basal body rod protein FlgC [Blastomonas marina]GGA13188.1 flagellar basal-body rod protein FlgC [Blastomonas marina]
MPGNLNIFDISGRAMSAQLTRMNTTASNLANARTTYSSAEEAYRALKPVFRSVEGGDGIATVDVEQVVKSNIEPRMRHDPNNPLADADGNVWDAGVDEAAELIDMIETARQYQNNVQVLQTAKSLILDTVKMGR